MDIALECVGDVMEAAGFDGALERKPGGEWAWRATPTEVARGRVTTSTGSSSGTKCTQ